MKVGLLVGAGLDRLVLAFAVVWKVLQRASPRPSGLTSGPGFEIVQCTTKVLDSATGPKSVVLMGANLDEAGAQEPLTTALFETFKSQRMMSPPDTSGFIVTIAGPSDRAAFVRRWRELVAADPVATFFMGRMEFANVGTAPSLEAPKADFESLLAP